MAKLKEIFYCNLTVIYKSKKTIIEKVVYKETDGFYRNVTELMKHGIKEDRVKVDSFQIIKSLGFENPPTYSCTNGLVSDEIRNKKTGAYE